jgi:hypothetical protein
MTGFRVRGIPYVGFLFRCASDPATGLATATTASSSEVSRRFEFWSLTRRVAGSLFEYP